MRWLHTILLLLGTALFVWLVAGVGVDTLWADAARLGAGALVIIALEGFGDFAHTAAWQRCFAAEHRPGPLRLWGPHLAGAAVNFLTPTATFGGEVVRGTLTPRGVPPAEVTSSLAINKLTATLADTAIALGGVGVLLVRAPLATGWKLGILAGAGLFLTLVASFLVLQRRGRLAGIVGRHRALARCLGPERAARVAQVAEDIDGRIASFHAERPAALLASSGLHLAGVSVGALQLHLFLRWMGAPSDLETLLIVFLVARAIDVTAFFVPARLGAQEGGRMFAMALVGIEPALGLLFALVLRVEQIVWAGIGLLAYAAMLWQRRRELRAMGALR